MAMNMFDYVQTRLRKHSQAEWREISRATRVPFFTLSKIAYRQTTNPTIKNLQPLYDWFQKNESKAA